MRGRRCENHKYAATADSAKVADTTLQLVVAKLAIGAITASALVWPLAGTGLLLLLQIGFLNIVGWRLLTVLTSQPRFDSPSPSIALPRYSIIVAIYDEAAILPYLIEQMSALDYPPELLDGYLALEAHEQATIDAANALQRPPPAPSTTPCRSRRGTF